jgi:hypothetical protein
VSDVLGALQLPSVATADGILPEFPELGYIASFAEAVLLADTATQWAEVSPKWPPVVKTFTHDPKILFDDSKLPALYVYGDQQTAEIKADDIVVIPTTIQFRWVLEPSQEATEIRRAPAFSLITRALIRAFLTLRNPAWKVTGDTDPYADTWGSSLYKYCGIWIVPDIGKFKPTVERYEIIDGDGKSSSKPFFAAAGEIMFQLVVSQGMPTSATMLDQTIEQRQQGGDGTTAYVVGIGDYPVHGQPLP